MILVDHVDVVDRVIVDMKGRGEVPEGATSGAEEEICTSQVKEE